MNWTVITLTFPDEAAAERGLELFRDMVRIAYADMYDRLPAEAKEKGLVLCQKFFLYRSRMKDYDPGTDYEYYPQQYEALQRTGNAVSLRGFGNMQTSVDFRNGPATDEFFIQLCEAAALEEPDASFEGLSEFEETVSATVQTIRAEYRDRTLEFRERWRMEDEEREEETYVWKVTGET